MYVGLVCCRCCSCSCSCCSCYEDKTCL